MKKRLLIFSDSLALPRNTPEQTIYEDTYPYLLNKNYQVFQFSKGGGLIKEFVEQTFYYNQYHPDIVIIQMGIVDCAPRAFTKLEEAIFDSNRVFRWIRRFLSNIKATKYIRKIRQVSWTPPKDFISMCEFFIDKFHESEVFALSIVPASSDYEKQVPGITKKIDKYNLMLKNVFGNKYIDLKDIPLKGIMSDHHHLTKEGHQYIYNAILRTLNG